MADSRYCISCGLRSRQPGEGTNRTRSRRTSSLETPASSTPREHELPQCILTCGCSYGCRCSPRSQSDSYAEGVAHDRDGRGHTLLAHAEGTIEDAEACVAARVVVVRPFAGRALRSQASFVSERKTAWRCNGRQKEERRCPLTGVQVVRSSFTTDGSWHTVQTPTCEKVPAA